MAMLQRSLSSLLLSVALVVIAACQTAPAEPEAPAEEAAAEEAAAEEAAPEAAEAAEAAPEAPEAAAEEEAEEAPTHEVATEVVEIDGVRSLVATVTPINGYKVNVEFPWSLAVDAEAPVAAGVRHGRDDCATFTEEQARFVIPAEGEATGEVLANMRLGVCNEVGCITPRESVSWNLLAANTATP